MTLFSMATAAPVGGAAQGNPMGSSLLMLLIFGAFIYFLLWRPQSKRQKQHRDLVSNLKKEDEIMTSGGIAGKISRVEDVFIEVQIADNVNIKVQKNAISGFLPKGTLKF
jgi:preprotein translocase subunit YajC